MAGRSSHREGRLQTPAIIPPLDGNPNGYGVSIIPELIERNPIADAHVLIAVFIVNYLDRTNVGFAALTMNKGLGFSP